MQQSEKTGSKILLNYVWQFMLTEFLLLVVCIHLDLILGFLRSPSEATSIFVV